MIGSSTKNISAAVFAAAVLFLGPAIAMAQSDRFPAGPPNMFKPGSAITFYKNTSEPARIEGLNTALNTSSTQSQELASAITQARSGIADGVAASDIDALARDVAASIEGTFSIVVQTGFVRAMSQTNPAFARMLQTAQMEITVPGDTSVEVPVLIGAAIHALTVISASERIRNEAPARDMTGTYTLTSQGECAVRDGDISITQRDFVIEGVTGERLSVYGAIGTGRIYLVANEQRYAAITQASGADPVIEVPDRPSDLFEAVIPATRDPFSFKSITRGTCSFTLNPVS